MNQKNLTVKNKKAVLFISFFISFAPLYAEEPSYFQKGVQNYLKQDYDRAALNLKKAIEIGQDKEKAERLLLKVLMESPKSKQASSSRPPAASPPKVQNAPFAQEAPKVKSTPNVEKPKPIADVKISENLPQPFSSPNPTLSPRQPDPRQGGADKKGQPLSFYLGSGAVLAALFVFVYSFLQRQQMKSELNKTNQIFSTQMISLQEALRHEEKEKAVLARELESRKEMFQTLESSAQGLKEAQSSEIAAWKARLEESEKRILALERENQRLRQEARSAPPLPSMNFKDKIVSESKPALKPAKAAQFQKQQILDTLVKITPEGREEGQKLVMAQALSLFDTFPAEAIRFLGELARDTDPMVRLSMITALVEIPATEGLDILMALSQDENAEVKREALKALKGLRIGNSKAPFIQARLGEIDKIFQEEIDKAEWVL